MSQAIKYKDLTDGMTVSELCLGILPMGPLQANIPPEDCISIIKKAYEHGINFFDTAEMYRTQKILGEALKDIRSQVVIATKSVGSGYDEMAASVERSLKELDTDYIDIYHLHAARLAEDVFSVRSGAIRRLQEYKRQGIIRAVGIATHNCRAVAAAAANDDIDIVFALINKKGIGLLAGTVEDMKQSIALAASKGKGVYAMKALGGGLLLPKYKEAIEFVREQQAVASIAMGVVSEEELLTNINYFSGMPIELPATKTKRIFIFKGICQGCTKCVDACHNEAISMVDNKASVDHSRCLLCGYCSGECPEFAIRIV